ncbi:MAG TPA: hypothetical protein VII60_00485 [Acidimicrobiales bacterium]
MRPCSRLLVATLVLNALPVLMGATSAVAATAPSACSSSQVTLSATPDHSLYTSSTTVHVIVAMHNHSSIACSYTTGPFSPNFVLTNSVGITVWASCWFGGGPAPCADYLLHRILAPGATYRDQLTWDQRTGHPDLAVPAGRYTFHVNVVGLSLRTTTSFVLTRPRSVAVTLADAGRHYVLAVGDLLTVRLLASPLVWTAAVSSDPLVLFSMPEMNPVAGLFIFRALAIGTARVSAVGNPTCYPQCLMPSRLFFVNVTVRVS